MNLYDILYESKKDRHYLLGVSLVELINREMKCDRTFDLVDRVVILATLLELKSELFLHLFGLMQTKKRTFEEEKDVEDIIDVLEKTVEKTYERHIFVDRVSSKEFPYFRLARIVKEVLEREKYYENRDIKGEEISLTDILEALKRRLLEVDEIDFRSLIEVCKSKLEVIVTFLAVLILAKNRYIIITQEDNFSPIVLRRNEEGRVPLRN